MFVDKCNSLYCTILNNLYCSKLILYTITQLQNIEVLFIKNFFS